MSVGEMAEAQSRATAECEVRAGLVGEVAEVSLRATAGGERFMFPPLSAEQTFGGGGIRRGTSRRRWGSCDDPPCGASWWERPEVSAQLEAGSQALFF